MSPTPSPAENPVDAVLILSFGGPERPEDVMEFLRNVTRGRNVPDERLAEVAEQYALFGGRSPINDQCRDLATALEERLAATDHDLPVYFGARNWHPFVADTVRRMADDGVRHAAVFVTSAFGSYSGCRQYREDLARARDEVGPEAPELTKLRLFYNHPGFIDPLVDNVAAGLDRLADRKERPGSVQRPLDSGVDGGRLRLRRPVGQRRRADPGAARGPRPGPPRP